jgi:hypothetical protein
LSNPYVIDRPLGGQDLFFGREAPLERLVAALNGGQRLFLLYGKRYAGKTSFLNQLAQRVSARYVVQHVDPGAPEATAQPLWVVLLALATAFNAPRPDAAAYQAQPDAYAAGYVRTLVGTGEGPVTLVCVDALPQTLTTDIPRWQQALAALRAALPEHGRLGIVLAIEGYPLDAHAEPALANMLQIVLGPLSTAELDELLTIPVRGVLAYDYEAIRRIQLLTGGHAFFVQLFGHILYERRVKAGWVGVPEVDHAIADVVAYGAAQFEAVWAECAPLGKVVLCAFAEMMGHHGVGAAKDVSAYLARLGVQIPIEDIAGALDALVRAQVLERLGSEIYRFSSELLRHWLRRNRSTVDILRQARRYRRAHVRPISLPRARRIDWGGLFLWGVAAVLVLAIGYVWSMRQRGIVWTVEPTPIPLANTLAAQTPTPVPPTPDTGVAAGRIVYMAQDKPEDKWQIYVMRSDGSDPVKLTHVNSNNTSPIWSPDGRKIAFVSDRDGNREVYTMNADGNEPINLTQNAAEDWTPTWSPDGKRIAWASFRDHNWEIYAMNADGTAPVRLTNNTASDYDPAWSPDGRTIAFVSNRDGNLEIYTMDADGKNQKRFTNHPATDQAPAWSADGRQIFWESYRDGNMEIYSANVDGSGLRNVTHDSQADDHGATSSPWGRRIAFYSNHDGGWDIYTLDLESGERTNLTMSPAIEQAPNWGR